MASPSTDITETSPGYDKRITQWAKVRDVLEGEEDVKFRETLYLPRPRGMRKTDYANYLNRANFYAVADRTLRGLVGLVFRVDPVVKIPDRMRRIEEFASPEGYDLDQLIREALREVLSMGRYGMLVDLPLDADADSAPFLATWKAEEIFRWEEKVNPRTGIRDVTRVVVMEEPTVAEEKKETILREMFIDDDGAYKIQRWREVEAETTSPPIKVTAAGITSAYYISGAFKREGGVIVPRRFNQPLRRIPFIFINPYDLRARADKPTMLDLANVNLGHYRNSADYETALHMIGSPTPYVFGIRKEDRPTTIGPFNIWHGLAKDVRVGMLEYTGQGVATIRLAMRDKEDRMAVLGARLIRSDGAERENVTAETTRLEAREETSVLLSAAKTVEKAFERALKFAALWMGTNPESVEIRLNRDFVETRLSAQELTALVASWQAKALSDETLHFNLQRGEIVQPDRDFEEERSAIEAQAKKRQQEALASAQAMTAVKGEQEGDEEEGGVSEE
jgi:hypothetical protein